MQYKNGVQTLQDYKIKEHQHLEKKRKAMFVISKNQIVFQLKPTFLNNEAHAVPA